MRIIDILAAPRFAGPRATHWWALGFFALMAAGAIAVGGVAGRLIPDPRSTQFALFIYAFGAAILTMWLAMLLLVARDGRRLGLPGIVRNCEQAVCTYTLAIVAAPVVLVAVTGGDVAAALLFPALAVATSLAYMLLPLVIASALGFVPAIYIGLHNAFHAPSPFDPRFQHWAWLALAILVVVDVVRWRQLLRSERDDDSAWRRTMLLQMRGGMCKGSWWSIDQRWAWRRSGDKRTAVDFREVKSGRPANAIAVALGGWYVPQTLASRLASLARALVPALLFIPLMLFMNIGHERSLHKAWTIIGVSGGLWIGLFGGAMLALMTGALLQRRWKEPAGMALLALLPGIEGGHAAPHLARATFTKPAVAFVALWLCMLVPAVVLHSGPMALLLCTLVMAGMAAVAATAILMVMAGRPLGTLAMVALGVVVLVMINVSAIIGIVTPLAKLGPWAAQMQWIAVAIWLSLIAWAIWRSLKTWRALQQRPHPFLANAP